MLNSYLDKCLFLYGMIEKNNLNKINFKLLNITSYI